MASDPTPPGHLSAEEVAHVARLARLELSVQEVAHFAAQLSALLEHVEAIRRLDLSGLEPTAHPLELRNVMRDDERRPSLSRDEVLAVAPASQDGQFLVPPILGEEP
jgi:aspartyl-tRNA(Asn)/glutamyl-tRNA(Gln) amidotransferase subunit C